MIRNKLLITASLLSALAIAHAEDAPKQYSLNEEGITEFLKDGKPLINLRLRYEYADTDTAPVDTQKESNAVTLRTRLGYQTAPLYGFQGLVEMENIVLLNNDSDVNLAGSNAPDGVGYTNIPDPEVTELNRAWLSYTYEKSTLKAGRERIKLDDDRFVGNVGWRQNEQTFDMVSFKSTYFENAELFYAYVWHVNRIFGDQSPANPDFDGNVHLVNGSYKFADWLRLSAFAYLMDLESAATGANFAGSNDTFGVRATGSHKYEDTPWKADYAASFATQQDNGGSPTGTTFDLNYYALDVKGHYNAFWLGAGLEVLEGNGTRNFATPLATLHAFNGWADSFLGTSTTGTGGTGLEDYYLATGYTVPVGNGVGLKGFYHWYKANDTTFVTSDDLGTELDLLATYKINKYFNVVAKYANYDGGSSTASPADTQKLWLECTFNY